MDWCCCLLQSLLLLVYMSYLTQNGFLISQIRARMDRCEIAFLMNSTAPITYRDANAGG